MPNMQIAIGFRRKASHHPVLKLTGSIVLIDNLTNKIITTYPITIILLICINLILTSLNCSLF